MMQIKPSFHDVLALAKRAPVVPVYAELVADTETPVGALVKCRSGADHYLLESVEGGERVARFSFVGPRARAVIRGQGRRLTILERQFSGRMLRRQALVERDPLQALEQFMARYRAVSLPELPRFWGGLVGYLGYEVVRFFERLPPDGRRGGGLPAPEIAMMLSDGQINFDHTRHVLQVVAPAVLPPRPTLAQAKRAYAQAVHRVRELVARLQRPLPRLPALDAAAAVPAAALRSNLTPRQFTRMVRQAKEYIRAGDIIQAVLSQRFERPLRCDPLEVYRALRLLNPSPYMYYLRCGGLALAGSSPEMLVRCDRGQLATRPIAGTRRRGTTEQDEKRLIRELVNSPKERAEHVMLVDLGRNDLGRVARSGTVATTEFMTIEKYSHVMHLVSEVRAQLAAGRTIYDVLRAAFPAGTVSGAPKVRAMEIIQELEPLRRGPYAGAVGYISFTGNLDTCITIRTIAMRGRRAYVQAGAGIVADSHPAREYQETVSKARGMLQALAVAEQAGRRS